MTTTFTAKQVQADNMTLKGNPSGFTQGQSVEVKIRPPGPYEVQSIKVDKNDPNVGEIQLRRSTNAEEAPFEVRVEIA